MEDLLSSKDAVKKGDKSILDTIGNLYQKIKLTTKDVNDSEMMDMILSCGHEWMMDETSSYACLYGFRCLLDYDDDDDDDDDGCGDDD